MNLANRAQVLELLDACALNTDHFTANELEMYHQIKSKYSSSDEGTFDDKICLEVMLRNTGIRKSVNIDKNEATRVIDVEKE